MKALILSLSFFSIAFIGNAQQLTFNDLLQMNSGNSNEARNQMHKKKKWVEELSETNSTDSAVYVLKSEFKKQEQANHWLSVYSEKEKPKTISYQTTKKMYVDQIVTDLKSAGFILTGSRLDDTQRTLIYSNETVIVEVSTIYNETNLGTVYLVTINS